MWYFVEKNGKAIKPYKSLTRALNYAKTVVSFDSEKDVLRVCDDKGNIYLDW